MARAAVSWCVVFCPESLLFQPWQNFLKGGDLDDLAAGEYRIILGKELALSLGVWVGDKVTLMAPQASVTAAGILPRMKRFTIAGVFEAGMYEYDSGLVLIDMADAQTLYRLGDEVTGLRLKLDDIDAAPLFSLDLAKQLDSDYRVRNWTQEHVSFFRALKIEKNVMFVILMLIVAVAAFNLVSTLVMVVTDKQADIAILRTLGIDPGNIMSVFIYRGRSLALSVPCWDWLAAFPWRLMWQFCRRY